jgi:hypothetical protein
MSNRKIINAAATGGIGYYPVVGASDPYYDKVSLLLNGDTDVDTNFANVSVLLTGNDLLDKSNNRLVVTAYGQASVTSVKKQFGTGSYYFDGSGDYIRPAASDTCMFGTGDFTIEFWTYRISGGEFFGNGPAGGGSFGLGLGAANGDTTKLQCAIYGSPVANLSCVTNFPSNQWIHVAVTRASGTTRIFLNGVKDAETTAGGANNTTNTPSVGEVWLGSGSTLNGYIDDFRITKGVARYTANFTPPTAALPSHEILDSSVYRLPVTTYGNARIDTTTKKYGTGAMYFDGNGDYLSLSNSPGLLFGSGDFTIEFWFRQNAAVSAAAIFCNSTNSSVFNPNWFYIHANHPTYPNKFCSSAYNISTSVPFIAGTTNIVNDNWYHVALVRSGSTFNLYIDGTLEGTATSSASIDSNTVYSKYVGGAGDGGIIVNGYIDDLRVTKGYARTIVRPTAAFPTIPPTISADPWWGNVSLLLDGNTTDAYDPYWQNVSLMLTGDDFIDWSNQHNAITVVGNTSINTATKKYNSGSMYFDGSGDYLSIASNASLNISSLNFTIEYWIRPTAASVVSTDGEIIVNLASSGIAHYYNYTNKQLVLGQSNVAAYLNSTVNSVPLDTWTHVALVRNGNVFTFYINGISNATYTGALTFTDGAINIGAYTSSQYMFNGYLADLRITKGIARTIVVPTAALPAFKIQDRTQNNITLTPYGNVQLSTDVKKNGTGSMFFDGTGDYLGTPLSSNFIIGANDYTFEAWIMMADPTTGGCLYTDRVNSPDYSGIIINVRSGYLDIVVSINGSTWATNGWLSASGTQTIAANVWTHVAVCKTSNIWSMYVNGILSKTVTLTNNPTQSQSTAYLGYDPGGIPSFKGYIDDLRITKGYARYTQNFTPPSQSFATQYISTGFDPNYADVSLLLTGEGTNGSTTFTDLSSSPKTITAGGNAQISTAQKKYGTGAMYFDGTGDWLTLDGSSNFAYGTGDFTIEFWIQTSNWGGGTTIFYDQRPLSTDGNYPCIYTQVGQLRYFVNSADRITGSTLTTNTWYHIAVCRSGTSTKMFLNGVQDGSTYSDSTTYINGASRPIIATRGYNPGDNTFSGYIDDLRITKGIARYTTNFTPPTYALATTAGTPFDVNRVDTSLLLRGNGTNGSTSFTDESPNNLTITNNGSVTVNTSVKKYGTGSMYFDGTNYLSSASNAALNLSGVSWTVELWCYPTTASLANRILFTKRVPNSGTCSYQGYLNVSNSGISFFNGTEYQSSTTLDLNAWNHIAYVCDRTNVKVYKNGVLILTASATEAANNTETLLIGNGLYTGYSLQFPGYIDDFRITKGYARYTANFTPPTYEDPTVTGTQYDYNYAQVSLLLNGDGTNGSTLFTDLSSMPKTITAYGNAQISTGTKKFGTGSMYFDGTGDYFTIASNASMEFGSSDLTLEMWLNTTSTNLYSCVFGRQAAFTFAVGDFVLLLNYGSSGNISLSVGSYNPSAVMLTTTGVTINDGAWHHIALVRNGSSWALYVDGQARATQTFSGTLATSSATWYSGIYPPAAAGASGRDLTGYIDDLRITKGLARYTQNFTPPTAPLPTSGGY